MHWIDRRAPGRTGHARGVSRPLGAGLLLPLALTLASLAPFASPVGAPTGAQSVDIGALREKALAAFEAERWPEAISLYEQLAAADPREWRFPFRLGHALLMTGEYERSIEASRKAASLPGAPPAALYNIACAEARLVRKDDALRSLEVAISAGFEGIDRIPDDPDLANLRDDPRLARMLERVAAAEREKHPPLTWQNVPERMKREEAEGFSGTLLLVQNGNIVHSQGYGLANREKRIPATRETIYAIGSTPIDFTKAGILLLAQEEKLALADPITKYFDFVPADKQSITIEHLMTGQSGLQNFHGRPADPNPDHTYIDRDEAVRRILEGELLFAPGTDSEHSHSAWGLLAAIIEIVTGQSYPEFTRQRLFEPAGMKDTGFFGEPIPEERMAVGYGMETDGPINAPPFWGPTSWLVMGSGGQVSTVMDLHRWMTTLRAGKILRPEWLDRYFTNPGSVLEGGDIFGFGIVYTDAPNQYFILASNSHSPATDRPWQRLQRQLAALVNGASSRYVLGVQMEIDASGFVLVRGVVPGGPAERDGLRAGDLLLEANGQALGTNPRAVLDPLMQNGEPIEFIIERGGKALTVRVSPALRGQ